MFLQTIFIIALVAWVFFFKVWSGVISGAINHDLVKASYYAVEVQGLPTTREEGAPNETEIRNHFSKFGKVHSVSLIRDTGELLEVYQQAQERLMMSEIAKEQAVVKRSQKKSVGDAEQ